MTDAIGVRAARAKLGEYIDRAYWKHETTLLSNHGRTVALVPLADTPTTTVARLIRLTDEGAELLEVITRAYPDGTLEVEARAWTDTDMTDRRMVAATGHPASDDPDETGDLLRLERQQALERRDNVIAGAVADGYRLLAPHTTLDY